MTERSAQESTVGARRRFFLVERYIPSMSRADVDAATARLDRIGDGRTRHLGTVLISDEETCLSLFEASGPASVRMANDEAGFALHRIVEVSLFSSGTDTPCFIESPSRRRPRPSRV